MATHSSILAWEIPWAEEPGGLQSMGPQKSQTWLSDQTPPPPILHRVSMRDLLGKILIKLYTYLLKSGTIHQIQNGNKCNYILSPPMVEIIIHHLWYSCSFFLWLIFLSLSSMGQMSSCCSFKWVRLPLLICVLTEFFFAHFTLIVHMKRRTCREAASSQWLCCVDLAGADWKLYINLTN